MLRRMVGGVVGCSRGAVDLLRLIVAPVEVLRVALPLRSPQHLMGRVLAVLILVAGLGGAVVGLVLLLELPVKMALRLALVDPVGLPCRRSAVRHVCRHASCPLGSPLAAELDGRRITAERSCSPLLAACVAEWITKRRLQRAAHATEADAKCAREDRRRPPRSAKLCVSPPGTCVPIPSHTY